MPAPYSEFCSPTSSILQIPSLQQTCCQTGLRLPNTTAFFAPKPIFFLLLQLHPSIYLLDVYAQFLMHFAPNMALIRRKLLYFFSLPNYKSGTWGHTSRLVFHLLLVLKGKDGPWPQNFESIFIDLMDYEISKGNRSTTTFFQTSWQTFINELHTRTNYPNSVA